ncbi:24567_t:CDS:2 [Cetraspora pellucida]|uniref:24567_t:CDS:1 n=1 Tax=Cetraspora pellucida TaxID=1433469 RepID=A0A9N9HFG2_9GLOM|nr:24567_t:CDS:2 [Cetraspora pellucida]
MANTQFKTNLLDQISKLVTKNTKLKKKKAEFLVKKAEFMTRIMELEQNAKKARLKDIKLNTRIIELEWLTKENKSNLNNISDPIINYCIDTNFKLLKSNILEQVENISNIISDDMEHRASGSSNIC